MEENASLCHGCDDALRTNGKNTLLDAVKKARTKETPKRPSQSARFSRIMSSSILRL